MQFILADHIAQMVQALGAEDMGEFISTTLPGWSRRMENAPATSTPGQQVLLRPEKPRGVEAASIWYDLRQRTLCSRRPVRNREFWELMKSNGLEWCAERSRYERELNALTGDPRHRVAELCSVAYRAGWPVLLPDDEIADLVQRGNWIPEQKRWVLALKDGRFLLRWERGEDAVYAATKHLIGAEWSTSLQGTVLPASAGRDVEDFAAEWHFAFTPEARANAAKVEQRSARELLGVKLPDSPMQPARQRRAKPKLSDPGEVSIPAHLLLED